MNVDDRTRLARTASVALAVAGAVLFAACVSIPGRPDDPQDPNCLEHAHFGKPGDSPYVLPYPVGSACEVLQTYCGPVSHGRDGQMAVDFVMPMGSEVVAARAGIVQRVIDGYEDYGRRFNFIYVEHEDGTSAFYGHLQRGSARVLLGQHVLPGQVIALSGASGTVLAHLHFGVASSWPVRKSDDIPVNFKNGEGPLDERGGLKRGVTYRALPYSEN